MDTPWLLATCSLLATSISVILRPSGHQSFVEDVQGNLLFFSPFQAGRAVIGSVLYFIHLRLLNLAGVHASLRILCHSYSPSPASHIGYAFWPSFARRAFLLGATLPLHWTLLGLTSHRWLHIFATFLVGESVLAEFVAFNKNHSSDGLTVRRDWPRRTMLVLDASTTPDRPTPDHVDNEDKANGFGERKEDGNMPSSSASDDNLCDRIQQLWSAEADSDSKFALHSIPPKYAPTLDKIFSPHIQASKWTCGHWRCLVNTLSHKVQRLLLFTWYIEQASTVWLLRVSLHPVTLRVSEKVLQNNVLGGVLTMVYQISLVLALFFSGAIPPVLLFARLRKLEWVQRASQNLAESAPITYKTLAIFGKQVLPSIGGFLSGRFLFPADPSLTREILSYALDAVVVLVVCIIGYRLLIRAARSDTTPGGAEPQSGSTLSPEPKMAPKSNNQDPQSHQTSSDDKKNAPKGGSQYPFLRSGSGFQMFRLAIWALTGILWVLLHD
ncbi:trans-3-hydroxy-L-proline dehydratase [Aspergillus terreus]|uniref:Trans-3-hydroxy-L-proline dehydratase n=1 Tax=Aspergillus terreus TaxID=33178 RepID=A0A5M3YPS3_ASPTE|nr:hypothetical protein ATETN484_0002061900 [Aspergillus terreus]GFF15475.1 trans-3-hydroxy-L-proline dehydratase [Aspergillus terreus]